MNTMVIQPNMRVMDIAKIWPETIEIFKELEIPLYSSAILEDYIIEKKELIQRLNLVVEGTIDQTLS